MKLCFKSLHPTVKTPPSLPLRPAPPSNPEWFQCITSCSPVTHRNIFSERQKRQERHAGEIIPPAPPDSASQLKLLRQDRVNGKIMRGAVGEGVSVRKGSCCGAWGLGWALFGLRTQCRCAPCAHLRWPTPVRLAPDSRVKGKDFQMLGKGNTEGRAANADRKTFSQRSGERGRHQEPAPTAGK